MLTCNANATRRNSIIRAVVQPLSGPRAEGSLPRNLPGGKLRRCRERIHRLSWRTKRSPSRKSARTYTRHGTRACTSVLCTLTTLAVSRASVTNVSRGKRTLARLREAELDFLENPFDQNNDVPPRRFLYSFAYDRCRIIQRELFLLPRKAQMRHCDILFPVLPFILYVNRDITGKLHFI